MGCWRVNGTYAVSRAIGECDLSINAHTNRLTAVCEVLPVLLCVAVAAAAKHIVHAGDFDQKPYVSGDADCSLIQLLGDEDYVLLACDGLFDAVTPSMVPDLVLNALQQPGDSEGGNTQQSEEGIGLKVAQHLVAHAKAAGSSDNITVMVIFLRPPEQLLAKESIIETARATKDSTS